MKNKDKYLPGMGNPVQNVGRDMYGMGMNGYGMPNGYPMMHPDPYMAQQQAMAGQMTGLSQYGYQLPGSNSQMNTSPMSTSSYMNGSASYAYSMAPYMQGMQQGGGGSATTGDMTQNQALKSESPPSHQQNNPSTGVTSQDSRGVAPHQSSGQKADLRDMISMYLPTDRNQYASMQGMQGQYGQPGQDIQGNTPRLTHM